jgi:hypothetical protein
METTKSNIKKYNKVKPRELLMLGLFLGGAGLCYAGPQTASPVPGNPPNQAAAEPAGPTKIIRVVYRGEGYFDNALAEKLRSALTRKSEPATSHGNPAPTDSYRASLGSGDGSKRE